MRGYAPTICKSNPLQNQGHPPAFLCIRTAPGCSSINPKIKVASKPARNYFSFGAIFYECVNGFFLGLMEMHVTSA
jgi:hypothetical protein